MKARTLSTEAGVDITYRVVDDGGKGIPIVFAGGLGGTFLIWASLTKILRSNHKIIIWDYPGLTDLNHPADFPLEVADLAGYQKEIMDAENIPTACIAGWSLGSQVAFEFARQYKGAASHIVALCGTADSPFSKYKDGDPFSLALGLRSSVPEAVGWLSDRVDKIERLKTMLRKIEHPTRWAKRLGFVDPVVDDLLFDAVVRDFIELNPAVYRRYVESAAQHSASDFMKSTPLPVLVLAGEKDNMVPVSRVKSKAKKLKRGRFLEVRGATHFLPLEYPQLAGLEIDDFLKKHRVR